MTVVIGARNESLTLPRALKSLLAQSMPDWECVVVDDGSTDGTADAARIDPRVHVISVAPAGLTAALRRGCDVAQGDYVARLDADDECLPERLARQIGALNQNPDIAAIGCGVELYTDSGRFAGQRIFPADHAGLQASLDSFLTPIPHSTLMVRREVLRRVGGYRAIFEKAQDYDLLRRISEGGKLASLPESLVRLTVSSQSVTNSSQGGEQFEFCALAYASSVLRNERERDPLEGNDAAAFQRDFRGWYRASRLPSIFQSRLARRGARAAHADGRPLAAVGALVRATVVDPQWAFRKLGGDAALGALTRAWALSWAEGHR